MNTMFQLQRYALQTLKAIYDENEIRALCTLIFSRVFHYTNIQIHLEKHTILEESLVNTFLRVLQRLQEGEPLQYILGETEFAGLVFHLNRDTLIPRPETEELVMWIVEEGLPAGARFLDIGTGSGCIAIAVGAAVKDVQILGVDVSPSAVEQAAENARLNGVHADFEVRDILHPEQWEWGTFDVIASNPPYVRESEKALMEDRVLKHEPARALFVPDSDPLLFYREIARFGLSHLSPGGRLFFEINEALGSETVSLLEGMGYKDVELRADIFDKPRMVRGRLKS